MAWYALYKWFKSFRKTRYVNWVSWYKKYLYDEWFESLSEEQRNEELERIRKSEELSEKEFHNAIARLGTFLCMMDRATNNSLVRHIYKEVTGLKF